MLDCHRVQVGAQLLCIEEVFEVLPTHGYVVTRDKQYHRIDNTPELQAWVLREANDLRATRRELQAMRKERRGG